MRGQSSPEHIDCVLSEIAAKPSVKSRGKTNPRGIKRKMSGFPSEPAMRRSIGPHLAIFTSAALIKQYYR